MPHEVIMPALGMAQDTGLLVAWQKSSGDPVASGDVLFEVETDKTTMEVEAQAEGFLTNIQASAGDDVPVGSVIALIAETADGVSTPPEAPTAEAPADSPVKDALPTEATVEEPLAALHPTPTDRILASPKAKRLAVEQGLDLSRLVAHGVQQPFHVADLETLKSLPTEQAPKAAAQATLHISASVLKSGAEEFLARLENEGGVELGQDRLLTAFASSALRQATQANDQTLVIELGPLSGPSIRLLDPDRARVSDQPIYEGDNPPSLKLRDLTHTAITSVRLSADDTPVLTFGCDREHFILSLDFTAAHLSEAQALDFVTGMTERLADPLRHLV